MKIRSKVLCVLLAVVVIFTQIPAFTFAADQPANDPNVILQFNEDYTGWELGGGEITTDPLHPENGKVIKTITGGGWFLYHNLKPNTKYVASADIRIEGTVKADDVGLFVMDFKDPANHSDKIVTFADSKDYKNYKLEFTTGNNNKDVNITIFSLKSTVAYADNIVLKEASSELSPTPIATPEDTTILQFNEDYSGWEFGGGQQTTDPLHPENGNVIKMVTGGAWFLYHELKPNTKYVASADIRIEGTVQKDDVGLFVLDFIDPVNHSDKIVTFADSKDYKNYKLEFTTENENKDVNITVYSLKSTIAYADNIVLKEVASGPTTITTPTPTSTATATPTTTPTPTTSPTPTTEPAPTTNPTPVKAYVAISNSGWKATASSCQKGYEASKAIDSNSKTAWKAAKPMTSKAKDSFILDMKKLNAVDKLTISNGTNKDNYPRAYNVYISTDGKKYSASVASGRVPKGYSKSLEIKFAKQQKARYIKIVQSGTDRKNVFAIYDIKVYVYK